MMKEHSTNIDAPAGPKTIWDFLRSGRFSSEKRSSKHREYTHSGRSKRAKKAAKRVAHSSRCRNRSAKRLTGIKPMRKRVRT